MKTCSVFRIGPLAVLLLNLAPAAYATSITVDNQGWYQAGLIVEDGCTQRKEEHYFASWQTRSVDLDDFTKTSGCSKVKLTLQVAWYHLAYEDRYPTGFQRARNGVWIVKDGLPTERNRLLLGDLYLVLRGTTGWAEVDKYKLPRDLSGIDLSGAFLREANLSEMIFYGTLYTSPNKSILGITKLFKADLSGANLSGADLSRAYMWEANLSGASLVGTNLEGGNLWGANLSNADLRGANLRGTQTSPYNAILNGAKTDTTTICPNESPGPCW